MPFITTREILKAWMTYGYFGLTIYGPLRQGKTVLSIKILAEVYGIIKRYDWRKTNY